MPPRVQLDPLPWEIIESPWQPAHNIYFETIFNQGNGYFGVRGCLEEGFPDLLATYDGTYIAGLFDEFDDQFVELVNIPALFAVTINIGNTALNMNEGILEDYQRTLDMRNGTIDSEFYLD